MDMFIGPVVGEVTETTARVVVQPASPGLVRVVLTPSGGGPPVAAQAQSTATDPVVGLHLTGLQPATTYALAVHVDGAPVADRTGRVRTRDPGATQRRLLAVSCNFTVRQGNSRLWREIADRHVLPGAVDGILHIGDQIYADDTFGQAMHDMRGVVPTAGHEADVASRFRRLYAYAWNYPATREVLANTSNLMVWDDHELRNGWGSHDEDRTPGTREHWVGTVARRVFQEFQRQLWGPRDMTVPHEAHAHVFGATGVVFLDQRGGRSFGHDPALPYLGGAQWTWLRGVLASPAFAAVRALVVVTSVPLLYVGERAAELGGLVASDLRDQWSHPDHIAEQREMAKCLRDWKAAATERDVLVVGGDVHVGAFTDLEERVNGAWRGVIRQVITSPITNEPPNAIFWWGIRKLLEGRHDLTPSLRYRHREMTRRRNYAVLTVDAPPAGRASIDAKLIEDDLD